jgi:glycolate oxidase FAD binding subunit
VSPQASGGAGQPAALGGIAVEEGGATWRYAASGVLPAAVVKPRSVAEVVAVVADARRRRQAVIAVGRGARLGAGNPPRRYDVALSTAHLDGIERHVAEDMTVTVRAGTTLERLNRELGERGQWLPLDPAVADETTVGGLIAADACGPLRHAHGKVRDFLIGVELVSGGAEVVRGGGRVVKNVAGYDLPKLLCGSFGTLGVIVAATFKTRPRPGAERLYVVTCASVDDACRRALAGDRQAGAVSFLEALSEGACEAIGVEAPAALVIGTAGSPAEVEAEEMRLPAWLGGTAVVACEPGRAAAITLAVRNSQLPMNDDAVVGRIAVLPAALPALLGRIESEAAVRGVVVEISAHAAIGVGRCQIVGGDPQRAALFAEWLRLAVRQSGGWVTYEAIPESLRGHAHHLDAWGMSGPLLALMRGVKAVFDPDGILSPGRFVGGI